MQHGIPSADNQAVFKAGGKRLTPCFSFICARRTAVTRLRRFLKPGVSFGCIVVLSVHQGEAQMKKRERIREKVNILPTSMYLSKMDDAGWSLVALEWEREIEISGAPEPSDEPVTTEEIPFGLR